MILLSTLLLVILSYSSIGSDLKVSISDLVNDKGSIHYLIFNSPTGYPDEEKKGFTKGTIKATEKEFILKDLPDGEYSVSLIHDENDNSRLDTFLGIPKEGFAFSNNPRVFFGPPSFEKTKVKVHSDKEITLKMKYFK